MRGREVPGAPSPPLPCAEAPSCGAASWAPAATTRLKQALDLVPPSARSGGREPGPEAAPAPPGRANPSSSPARAGPSAHWSTEPASPQSGRQHGVARRPAGFGRSSLGRWAPRKDRAQLSTRSRPVECVAQQPPETASPSRGPPRTPSCGLNCRASPYPQPKALAMGNVCPARARKARSILS